MAQDPFSLDISTVSVSASGCSALPCPEPRLPSSGLVPLTLEQLGHRAASHSLTEFGLKCLGGPVPLLSG